MNRPRRLPRVRLTVRRMMLLIAGIAFAAFLVREFKDGLPPRFVIEGIPARMDRLRPGMTWQQTSDILGLEQSWLRGGTDARFFVATGNGHSMHENYQIGQSSTVTVMARTGSNPPAPTQFAHYRGWLGLRFSTDPDSGLLNWKTHKATRLTHASFSSDYTRPVEMPNR